MPKPTTDTPNGCPVCPKCGCALTRCVSTRSKPLRAVPFTVVRYRYFKCVQCGERFRKGVKVTEEPL